MPVRPSRRCLERAARERRAFSGEAGWSARHQQEVPMPLSLPIEPAAAKLLQDSPLALLLGMLLDKHIHGCR